MRCFDLNERRMRQVIPKCHNVHRASRANRMKIIIIDAGPEGLAVQITLSKKAINDVTVYKRNSPMNIRRQSYGLTTLHGSQAKKKKNVFDGVQQLDTSSQSHSIFDKCGYLVELFGRRFLLKEDQQSISRMKYNPTFNDKN